MKKNTSAAKIVLLVVALTSITTTHSGRAESAKQVSPELQFLAAGISNSYYNLKCAQAKLNYYEFISKGGIGNHKEDVEKKYQARWTIRNGMTSFRVERLGGSDIDNLEGSVHLVNDGTTARSLFENLYKDKKNNSTGSKEIDYEGLIQPSEGVMTHSDIWQKFDYIDPRSYVFAPGERLFSEVLLNPKAMAAYMGKEELDGSRCMKVEMTKKNGKDIFWIDVEHGFIIRQFESYRKNGAETILFGKATYSNLIESNGFWLPSLIEVKIFVDKVSNGAVSGQFIKRLKISDFKADCNIPEKTFDINWPVGTIIEDKVDRRGFTVIAITNDELIRLNSQRKTQGKKILSSRNIEQDELDVLNKQRMIDGKKELKTALKILAEQEDLTLLEEVRKGK